jgi:hypothetical protein
MLLPTWIGHLFARLSSLPTPAGRTRKPWDGASLDESEPYRHHARQQWLTEFLRHVPAADEMERLHGFTFAHLIDLEPRLEPLLWEARQAGTTCRSLAAFHQAISTVGQQLYELVGFARPHRVLGSVGAYEVAYWKLLHAVADSVPGSGSPRLLR